jgi:hypothetical protein
MQRLWRSCLANLALALGGIALYIALVIGLFGVYCGLLLAAATLWLVYGYRDIDHTRT